LYELWDVVLSGSVDLIGDKPTSLKFFFTNSVVLLSWSLNLPNNSVSLSWLGCSRVNSFSILCKVLISALLDLDIKSSYREFSSRGFFLWNKAGFLSSSNWPIKWSLRAFLAATYLETSVLSPSVS